VDQVELNGMGGGNFFQFAVAGPDRFDIEAYLFEQSLGRPDVAADVIIADERDVIRCGGLGEFASFNDVVAN